MRTPQARIEHYLILIFIVQPFLTVPGPFRGWSGSCVHTKGGVCTIHGKGAKMRWRFGGKKTEKGKDGRDRKSMVVW